MTKKLIILLGLLLLSSGCTSPAPEAAPPAAASDPIATAAIVLEATEDLAASLDLSQLWSYGLTSVRTGEPLIEEGGEHNLDPGIMSFGYNLVVDRDGNRLAPSAAPLSGGEQLVLVDQYQEDHNLREYARIVGIMAPIRDAILYHFEDLSKDEWLAITDILAVNNIKAIDAAAINSQSVLSTGQVYDFIAGAPTDGSPVMRYLEEAELELKCLAFVDFDFTNPEGGNHCEEHGLEVGSGLQLP